MAVMDFREGGYIFARHKVRREFEYDQDGWETDQGSAGEGRFAANPDGTESITSRLARLTHYLGAIASVGLMVGLMVWGWQLVSRDVSALPVIAAVKGDARTTPKDPGGELTSYTGYAVNEVAEGAEPSSIEQVAIAPSVVGLTDDDKAMGQYGATAQEPANPPETPLTFDGEPITPLSDSEMKAQAAAEAKAAAERAAADAAVASASIVDAPASEGPVNEMVTDETGAPAQSVAITAALAEAQKVDSSPVLASSSRPAPRPRERSVAPAAASRPAESPAAESTTSAQTASAPAPAPRPAEAPAAEAAAAEAAEPVQTAQASAGGALVQIGAFDSEAVAQSEWNRLSGKFGSLFSGKGQVIQQHKSNGRTYWRLRAAGFDSRSDAQKFCAEMQAGGTDCLALAAQ